MGLNLTKYRASNHSRIAVGGSYTDSHLEVMANSSTSSNVFGYVRWVPNNKDGTQLTGVNSDSLAESGFLQWTLKDSERPWYLFVFNYYDDTNTYNDSDTSPGIRLVQVNNYATDSSGKDALATAITNIHTSNTDYIYVVVNDGRISSDSALKTAFEESGKSWRHVKLIGTNTTLTNHTYCAIGTNMGSIGYLAENIAGQGSNHIAAFCQIVVEHDKDTIGHAGYGEDLSSGFGSGTSKMDMGNGDFEYTINWSNANKFGVSAGEGIRLTYDAKIGQGAKSYNGYITTAIDEYSATGTLASTTSNTHQVVDGWTKGELVHTKQSNSNTQAKIRITAYDGSGVGRGYDRLDLKNMQAFKCGYNPDNQRDVAVHKYHLNALNIEESPGPFRIGEPTEFYSFWNSSRNILGQSNTYYLNTTNSSTQSNPKRPINKQYRNASDVSYGIQGEYNFPIWFNREYNQTTNSSSEFFQKECFDATVNHEYNQELGVVDVDHTKVYVAGVWVRIRRNDPPTGGGYTPQRLSLVGRASNSGSYQQTYGTTSTLIADSKNYLQTILFTEMGPVGTSTGNGYQEWQLLNGFYLPSWMTASERLDWKNNYWSKWAGHFEFGGGTDTSIAEGGISPGYGITSNAVLGYVAGMTSNITQIRPTVRIEQYQSTDVWAEFALPFVVEIDPMNFNDEGNAYLWDFTENPPL